MGIFSKNKDLENKSNAKKMIKKGEDDPYVEEIKKVDVEKEYPYIVQLNDINDSTIVRRAPFGAKRDIQGANVFLVNEKIGFKEPMPEDSDEYKQYKIDELEDRILELEDKIESHRSKGKAKTPEYLDWLVELKTMKGFKRSLELSGKGSYAIVSQEHGGRLLYTFDRKGNFKLPVYKNVDYSLLYVPNESDIQLASELIEENDKANGITDNTLKLANLAILVLLILAFVALVYFGYKTSTLPEGLTDSLSELTKQQGLLTEKLTELFGGIENVADKLEIKPTELNATPSQVNVNG